MHDDSYRCDRLRGTFDLCARCLEALKAWIATEGHDG